MSEELEKKKSNKSTTGRKRGRPPKAETLAKREAEAKKKTTTTKTNTETTAPRRRGRPTKAETLAKREAELKEKIAAITKDRKSTIVVSNMKKEQNKEKTTEKEIEINYEDKQKNEEKEDLKEELKELAIKKDPKELIIDDKKMEKIEEEIVKQKSIPKEEKKKIYKKTFKNILLGALIILYFIFINLGFYNINETTYLTDLRVFSGITIIATIVIFEKAYKKDDDEKAIFGMEMLILSIATLLTLYVYDNFNNKFTYIINAVAILFALYYAIKSTVVYIKMRKKAKKDNNDIRKIIKK